MMDRYNNAEITIYNGNDSVVNKKRTISMDPDLIAILSSSRNYNELLYYWKAWRDVVGKPSRKSFVKYLRLINQLARKNGFKNNKEWWISVYELENFTSEVIKLYKQILPLYKQLHAYVRRRLIKFYGNERILNGGPIPAHLLGANSKVWTTVEDIVRPYSEKQSTDINKNMKNRNLTVIDMVKLAEQFYKSLGFPALKSEFWELSTFIKPVDYKINCHPSTQPGCAGKDISIRMCADVNSYYFHSAFHEIGHVYETMSYSPLLYIYHNSPNPGFQEAIPETINLSSSTPEYLHSIGLLPHLNDSEHEMNFLMASALYNIPLVMYAYAIETWRYGAFDGTISFSDMNKKWWEFRLKYQGICPPVRRTEDDFDPTAIPHFSYGIPYIRYFFARILQFQFHKGLCEASGYSGPLHRCNIYGSLEAGQRLWSMMRLGRSKPWPEALLAITGNETQMKASALLEYYKPLYDWLVEQNQGESIGWYSDDSTICPQAT